MSASLVGSEMCIRDRLDPGPNLQRRRSLRQGAATAKRGELASTARWLCPVSYTHLTLPTICSV
eukprot:15402131-Alexandrium_andersonii.AAC.1